MEPDQPLGFQRILAEQRRHIEEEGWTPEHDDTHTDGSLAQAAFCYAQACSHIEQGSSREEALEKVIGAWPFERHWFKLSNNLDDNYVKAGSLYLAELMRLRRAGYEGTASVVMHDSVKEMAAHIDRLFPQGHGATLQEAPVAKGD
jgi:hypothetical protein